MDPPVFFNLFVTHAVSEGPFLRLWGQKDKAAALEVEKQLMQLTPGFEKGVGVPLPNAVNIDTLCCAPYTDGTYYRARVLDVNHFSGHATCLLIDYGSQESVHLSSLRIPDNVNTLFRSPAQACSYILSNAVGNWTVEGMNHVKERVEFEEVKCMVVKTIGVNHIPLIKLYHEGQDLVDLLQGLGVCTALPQDRFDVMIWTTLAVPNPTPTPPTPVAVPTMPYPAQAEMLAMMWQQMMGCRPMPMAAAQTFPPTVAVQGTNGVRMTPGTGVKPSPLDMRVNGAGNANALSRFETTPLNDGTEHEVYISYVEKGTFSFAVQLAQNAQELESLVSKLNSPAMSFSKLKPPYLPGTICLGRYSEDNSIYRGVITHVEFDKCQVYFVDYGNSDAVTCQDLFEIPAEFTHAKAMAVPFTLAGVNDVSLTEEMTSIFSDLILDQSAILRVVPLKCEMAKQTSELFMNDTNVRELINIEICKRKPKGLKLEFRNVAMPEPGCKVKVLVAYVKSLREFYVQLAANQHQLESVMAAVSEHCNIGRALNESEVQAGTACCALFPADEQWYRALVIDSSGLHDLKVMYVDYGNEEKVSLGGLKSANEDLVNQLRAQAIPCSLAGCDPKQDEELVARFEEMTLEKTFTMHVLELKKDDIPQLVVRLTDENGSDISTMLGITSGSTITGAAVSDLKPSSASDATASKSISNERTNGWSSADSRGGRTAEKADYAGRSRDGNEQSSGYGKQNGGDSRWGDRNGKSRGYDGEPNQRDASVWASGAKDSKPGGHCDRTQVDSYEQPIERQNRGYQSHQNAYERNPKPLRIEVPTVSAICQQTALPVGSSFEVTMSWFDHPWKFYIQLKSNLDDFNQKTREMQDDYKHMSPLSSPSIGQAVVAVFNADKAYYRAIVKVKKGEKYGVQYVDYGNRSLVESSLIYGLQQKHSILPACAFECSLHGVLPVDGEQWSKNSSMTQFLMDSPNYTCTIVEPPAQAGAPYLVSLSRDGMDVAQLLVERQMAKSDAPPLPLPVVEDVIEAKDISEVLGVDINILVGQLIPAFVERVQQNILFVTFKPKGDAPSSEAEVYEVQLSNVEEASSTLIGQQVVLAVQSSEGRIVAEVLDALGQQLPFASTSSTANGLLPLPIMQQRMKVTVVHASGSSVWLQLVRHAADIDMLLDSMFTSHEDSSEPLTSILPGVLCAAKSLDGNWYRASIDEVDSGSVTVKYCDYGNSEVLPYDSLKNLDESFLKIPALCVEASLPIVTDDPAMGETILEKSGEKALMAVFVKKEQGWLVELLDCEEVMSLDLIRTGRALSMENSPFPAIFAEPEFSVSVGSSYPAEVSFIKSAEEFYVHLSCRSKQVEKMQEDLLTVSHCMKSLDTPPEVGSRVMALYSEDESWYRGEVLSGNRILFLDYGNDEVVDTSNLKTLPPALVSVPNLALKCTLASPRLNSKWSSSAEERFVQLTEAPFSIIVSSIQGDFACCDVINDAGLSVSNALAEEGFLEEIDSGDGVAVTVVYSNSPSDFFIHLNSDTKAVEEMGSNLEEAHNFAECEDKSPGTTCAALFPDDCLWYRAKIIGSQDDDVTVQFIDYGNEAVTTSIRCLPQKLQEIPPLALHCCLPSDGSRWSESATEKFNEFIDTEGVTFKAELLSSTEPFVALLTLGDGRNVAHELGLERSRVDEIVADHRRALCSIPSSRGTDPEMPCQPVTEDVNPVLAMETSDQTSSLESKSSDVIMQVSIERDSLSTPGNVGDFAHKVVNHEEGDVSIRYTAEEPICVMDTATSDSVEALDAAEGCNDQNDSNGTVLSSTDNTQVLNSLCKLPGCEGIATEDTGNHDTHGVGDMDELNDTMPIELVSIDAQEVACDHFDDSIIEIPGSGDIMEVPSEDNDNVVGGDDVELINTVSKDLTSMELSPDYLQDSIIFVPESEDIGDTTTGDNSVIILDQEIPVITIDDSEDVEKILLKCAAEISLNDDDNELPVVDSSEMEAIELEGINDTPNKTSELEGTDMTCINTGFGATIIEDTVSSSCDPEESNRLQLLMSDLSLSTIQESENECAEEEVRSGLKDSSNSCESTLRLENSYVGASSAKSETNSCRQDVSGNELTSSLHQENLACANVGDLDSSFDLSKVKSERHECVDNEIIISLRSYPSVKSLELDTEYVSHGPWHGKESDMECELQEGVTGSLIYKFNDCEYHNSTVDVQTSS